MPPFTFEGYRSPYVGTIADLIQAPGRAQAAGELAAGDAKARAAQDIGAAVGGLPAQVNAGIEQNQKIQQQNLALTDAKRGQAARQTFSEILSSTPKQSEDGVSIFDVPAIAQQMADKGYGPEAAESTKYLNDINNAFRAERAAKLAVVQRGAQGIIAAGNDPDLASHFLDTLEQNQTFPKADIDAYRAFIKANPANVAKLTAALAGPAKFLALGPGQVPFNETTQTAGAPPVPEKPTEASIAVKAAQGDPESIAAMKLLKPQTDKGRQAEWGMLDGKAVAIAFDPDDGKRYDSNGVDVTARVQPMPPASVIVNNQAAAEDAKEPEVTPFRPDAASANKVNPRSGLTPNMVFQNGIAFALTNTSPNLGFGQNASVRKGRDDIQNKAAAMATAAGTDFPTLRAEYSANKKALDKLLPTTIATAGFAQTALDNLDLAKQQSPKVPRTDSPIANRYDQWVDGHELAGNPALTTLETYIYTASREYAKVVSGSALSSQGLTDAASREAGKLINAAQSPEAFDAAITAMQNDMANVTKNQAAKINDISSTIGNFLSVVTGGGRATAPSPLGNTPPPGAGDKDIKPPPKLPAGATITRGKR